MCAHDETSWHVSCFMVYVTCLREKQLIWVMVTYNRWMRGIWDLEIGRERWRRSFRASDERRSMFLWCLGYRSSSANKPSNQARQRCGESTHSVYDVQPRWQFPPKPDHQSKMVSQIARASEGRVRHLSRPKGTGSCFSSGQAHRQRSVILQDC